jgi:cytochrome c553
MNVIHWHPSAARFALTTAAMLLALMSAVPAARAADPDEVQQDHPLAYWRFEDAAADAAGPIADRRARSETGSHAAQYRGAVADTAGVPGIGGQAATFQTPGAHVWVPPDAALDGNVISVEFWFNSTQAFPDRYWPGSGTFLSKATASNASSDWVIIAGSARAEDPGRVIVGSGAQPGSDVTLYSPTRLSDGLWHHVVWTRSAAGENCLYIDGDLAAVGSDSGGTVSNTRPITIGGDPVLGGRDLLGAMDEVAIYDYALAPRRVQAHFRSADLPGGRLFADVVAPLLEQRCGRCHSGDEPKGGLNLTTRAGLLAGGDSGAVVEPGKSRSSLLYRLITHEDEPHMPAGSDRLSDEAIARLAEWIDAGVPYTRPLVVTGAGRDFWSFRRLMPIEPPEVDNRDWPRGGIDRFVLSALTARGAQPRPEADRRTLIRRLSFDLVGLPPTPGEVAEFCADTGADAYERLVDRLLASPRFGERWGRHWLDVARYADSAGYESDQDRLNLYYYRDFVITALNEDMPFDRFVEWQLAGDEYAPDDRGAQAATGFLAAGPAVLLTIAGEGTAAELEQYRYDELDDMVSTVGSGLLGLTAACARCHDHKFDPIPTRDYYRLAAVFGTTERRHLTAKSGEKIQVAALESIRTASSRLLLSDKQPVPIPTFLLSRGDPQRKLEPATAGFLSVLTPDGRSEPWLPGADPSAATTRQRKALAQWMVDVDRGAGHLLARVIVNRLWQHHFGEGIVRTPNDFGAQGERPVNAALLDWLAEQLVAAGWRLKPLHKQIVMSAAYRQLVSSAGELADVDPEARFYFRRPRRLEAEALRDSILAVSDRLDLTMFGPPVKAFIPPAARAGRDKDNLVAPEADGPEQWRRSIYLFVKRSAPMPWLQAFDMPPSTSSCGRRSQSIVPTQALALLNDEFVRRQAREFARRVATAGTDTAGQIDRAYILALGRHPSENERAAAGEFFAHQPAETALANFCHVLLALNEFCYID